MENIYITVSVAFATNRKRIIFADESVKLAFEDTAKDVLCEKGIKPISFTYYPNAVCITELIPIGITPEMSAKYVKTATSSLIRNQFPKYSKMHALWTRQTWWARGAFSSESQIEFEAFLNEQKSQ